MASSVNFPGGRSPGAGSLNYSITAQVNSLPGVTDRGGAGGRGAGEEKVKEKTELEERNWREEEEYEDSKTRGIAGGGEKKIKVKEKTELGRTREELEYE